MGTRGELVKGSALGGIMHGGIFVAIGHPQQFIREQVGHLLDSAFRYQLVKESHVVHAPAFTTAPTPAGELVPGRGRFCGGRVPEEFGGKPGVFREGALVAFSACVGGAEEQGGAVFRTKGFVHFGAADVAKAAKLVGGGGSWLGREAPYEFGEPARSDCGGFHCGFFGANYRHDASKGPGLPTGGEIIPVGVILVLW